MAKSLGTIKAFTGGLVTDVSPLLLDRSLGYAKILNNADITTVGVLRKRPGTESLFYPVSGKIIGMHQYVKTSTGDDYLIIAYEAEESVVVSYWDGEHWIGITTGLTKNYDVNFLTFADKVFIVNGEDEPVLWDGTSAETLSDVPIAKYMAEFRLRAVAAGMSGLDSSKIKLSHTGDPTKWDVEEQDSNAVEFYVSPDDGEAITGILNVGDGGLLIGKPTQLYGLFGYTRKDMAVDLLDSQIGSMSHKAMKFISPYAYFVDRNGIYRYMLGQSPEIISASIEQSYFSLVDRENLDKARSFIYKRYYVICLPTEDGWLTLAYHVDQQKWIRWSLQIGEVCPVPTDYEGDVYFTQPNGGQLYRLTHEATTDAGGSPIELTVQLLDIDAESMETEKDFDVLYILVQCLSELYNLTVSYRVDNGRWHTLLDAYVDGAEGDYAVLRVPVGKTGRFLKVRIENNIAGQDIALLGMSYTFINKEVR